MALLLDLKRADFGGLFSLLGQRFFLNLKFGCYRTIGIGHSGGWTQCGVWTHKSDPLERRRRESQLYIPTIVSPWLRVESQGQHVVRTPSPWDQLSQVV